MCLSKVINTDVFFTLKATKEYVSQHHLNKLLLTLHS